MPYRGKKSKLSEQEQLERFVENVKILHGRRFIQSGAIGNYQFNLNVEPNRMEYQEVKPDEEDFRSFLIDFRRVALLQNEQIYISKIFNICLRYSGDKEFTEKITILRSNWHNLMSGKNAIAMRVNKKRLTPEFVLDIWINGGCFHDDPDKAREYQALTQDMPIPLMQMQINLSLPQLTTILLVTANEIEDGLNRGLLQFPQ